ncbi:hypothetical protein CLOM_g23756 [Closterium sp. NIES-68]|nr:hypothetical protein CLOM_g23756 [Closterium sp. NIES-68]
MESERRARHEMEMKALTDSLSRIRHLRKKRSSFDASPAAAAVAHLAPSTPSSGPVSSATAPSPLASSASLRPLFRLATLASPSSAQSPSPSPGVRPDSLELHAAYGAPSHWDVRSWLPEGLAAAHQPAPATASRDDAAEQSASARDDEGTESEVAGSTVSEGGDGAASEDVLRANERLMMHVAASRWASQGSPAQANADHRAPSPPRTAHDAGEADDERSDAAARFNVASGTGLVEARGKAEKAGCRGGKAEEEDRGEATSGAGNSDEAAGNTAEESFDRVVTAGMWGSARDNEAESDDGSWQPPDPTSRGLFGGSSAFFNPLADDVALNLRLSLDDDDEEENDEEEEEESFLDGGSAELGSREGASVGVSLAATDSGSEAAARRELEEQRAVVERKWRESQLEMRRAARMAAALKATVDSIDCVDSPARVTASAALPAALTAPHHGSLAALPAPTPAAGAPAALALAAGADGSSTGGHGASGAGMGGAARVRRRECGGHGVQQARAGGGEAAEGAPGGAGAPHGRAGHGGGRRKQRRGQRGRGVGGGVELPVVRRAVVGRKQHHRLAWRQQLWRQWRQQRCFMAAQAQDTARCGRVICMAQLERTMARIAADVATTKDVSARMEGHSDAGGGEDDEGGTGGAQRKRERGEGGRGSRGGRAPCDGGSADDGTVAVLQALAARMEGEVERVREEQEAWRERAAVAEAEARSLRRQVQQRDHAGHAMSASLRAELDMLRASRERTRRRQLAERGAWRRAAYQLRAAIGGEQLAQIREQEQAKAGRGGLGVKGRAEDSEAASSTCSQPLPPPPSSVSTPSSPPPLAAAASAVAAAAAAAAAAAPAVPQLPARRVAAPAAHGRKAGGGMGKDCAQGGMQGAGRRVGARKGEVRSSISAGGAILRRNGWEGERGEAEGGEEGRKEDGEERRRGKVRRVGSEGEELRNAGGRVRRDGVPGGGGGKRREGEVRRSGGGGEEGRGDGTGAASACAGSPAGVHLQGSEGKARLGRCEEGGEAKQGERATCGEGGEVRERQQGEGQSRRQQEEQMQVRESLSEGVAVVSPFAAEQPFRAERASAGGEWMRRSVDSGVCCTSHEWPSSASPAPHQPHSTPASPRLSPARSPPNTSPSDASPFSFPCIADSPSSTAPPSPCLSPHPLLVPRAHTHAMGQPAPSAFQPLHAPSYQPSDQPRYGPSGAGEHRRQHGERMQQRESGREQAPHFHQQQHRAGSEQQASDAASGCPAPAHRCSELHRPSPPPPQLCTPYDDRAPGSFWSLAAGGAVQCGGKDWSEVESSGSSSTVQGGGGRVGGGGWGSEGAGGGYGGGQGGGYGGGQGGGYGGGQGGGRLGGGWEADGGRQQQQQQQRRGLMGMLWRSGSGSRGRAKVGMGTAGKGTGTGTGTGMGAPRGIPRSLSDSRRSTRVAPFVTGSGNGGAGSSIGGGGGSLWAHGQQGGREERAEERSEGWGSRAEGWGNEQQQGESGSGGSKRGLGLGTLRRLMSRG